MAGIRTSAAPEEMEPVECIALMGQSFSGFGWWALDTFAFTIIITWLYLGANGNVWVAGLIPHFVINGMGAAGAWLSRPAEAVALALVAFGVVAVNRELFFGRPQDFVK